ncbi:survival of motor neuron-related-splicing factor 30-like [Macrosteles quadrilineatus]|uniref:survival of motor neuron-related-splicing factor 30-like n=1 Tax=Macrosteles quadrilineatus TaxID=74068 RepID=UPI0023E2EC5D|nr:survival of motor neuron-related-splicing factor 30-like [Macrosteles quadrilineatus]XP_054267759.1 survival of motor neuron-related-splicing factor 30-like [Macrosteles quadrilineatus]XP_054269741.1 survival of motor neuron-related-splicing factor 30-like [Macrosteles quadrilineatus]
MAEEDLQNYKLQLQQVEAALTTDPDNEELHKLKTDLEEVIQLTLELIKTQLLEEQKLKDSAEGEIEDSILEAATSHKSKHEWIVGDRCLALWTQDGQYYEATIESIDGEEVSVIFDQYKSAQVSTLEFIKELPHQEGSLKHKKQPISKVREYQKKKKQKKLQRYKQLEEEREQEKNKWLAFSHKTTKKGIIRKSIFASPDNVNGRVGIGTCGVSGKGMTEFTSAEKWRKGV